MRVMIVDDHQLTRQGLCSLIEKAPTVSLVADADNGRNAINKIDKTRPDIVVMDLAMPDMNGIEASRKIQIEFPDVKVLALSMHTNNEYVRQAFEAGVKGYIVKDCAFDELITALETVHCGRKYLSPQIADVVVDDYLHQPAVTEDRIHTDLSARECEVLQLIAEGKSTKDIAGKLGVSVKTIETHRRNIQQTLNLNSIAEMTKYAVRSGLTSLDN